jgi:hypothetical protein
MIQAGRHGSAVIRTGEGFKLQEFGLAGSARFRDSQSIWGSEGAEADLFKEAQGFWPPKAARFRFRIVA